ncbi:Pyrroline-5-carboxylate dehydrogenase [Operophtera brumata]|uniref:L-glutamate gamma-semialdehyde dehydrogenase n=1 Tax=Operophtera brumata TaxID=104452 RepID=A0A0L7LHN5_OPEBR|nr:Pyrroline-5-carboxylate dehydrogenase [Operophtera brumata]
MLQVWSTCARSGRSLERSLSSIVKLPKFTDHSVKNEPVLGYRAGSAERAELEAELRRIAAVTEEVPIVIGNENIKDGEPRYQVMPHDHSKKIAKFYYASEKTIKKAIKVSVEAQRRWDRTPLEERIGVWQRAADMMAGAHRQRLNAATMLGQSKTVVQAEIDASAELIDFFRFNMFFLKECSRYQPISEEPAVTRNSLRFRGIDGFNYPRLIGECGGKNYHFVHPSADPQSVVSGTIRSAFEYCGQKCSACSRMYVPRSLYEPITKGLIAERDKLKIGNPSDFSVFAAAVIDDKAFARITGYIDYAKKNPKCKIIAGGKYDGSKGYFVQPTIIETSDPHDKLMTEEIFGPVVAMYVYEDKDVTQALSLVGSSTKFALTGAVFAQDVAFLHTALEELKMTAGNFYINDKSTGSVVGQQPFGGGRMSGTNDKAGGPNYVMRWTTPQSIKETFVPLRDIDYPYMRE